jgi:transglutaminase-like putative cysteine protease
MIETLRPLLVLLTLINLLFVLITGSVPESLLLPLFALTLASTWLVRLQRHAAYRIAWNGGVLVIFVLLVDHALTTGLLHMLEDGLLLAALCQVHLLNNIGPRQRPDLMFFNSFLIAFITSFFCQDLGWSLAFFAYAVVLIPSLQLFAVLRVDQPAPPGVVRAVWRDSLPRTATVLLCTGLVFALWPRDFHREGFLGDRINLGNEMQAGLGAEIRLDRATKIVQSDAVVMRIRPTAGGASSVPDHWRGVTFVQFDGTGWRPVNVALFATRMAADPLWSAGRDESWNRAASETSGELRVQLLAAGDGVLPTPLATSTVRLQAGIDGLLIDPKVDGTLSLQSIGPAVGTAHPEYVVRTGRFDPKALPRPSEHVLNVLRQLPSDRLPVELTNLSRSLRGKLPADATPETIAESLRAWLQSNRRYALPGSEGFARNLGQFLLGTNAGHCEYFATTLALLLRVQEIPCRVVGGYLATEWDATAGETVVRRRDAHAWVEALLPGRGWVTLDATPAAELASDRGGSPGWLDAFGAALATAWGAVTGFDGKAREELLAWLANAPWDVAFWLRRRPLVALTLASLLIAWLLVRRRRRGQEPPSIRNWQRAVRRAGLRLTPGETPRELLVRARGLPLPPARLETLALATAAHEAERYRSQ